MIVASPRRTGSRHVQRPGAIITDFRAWDPHSTIPSVYCPWPAFSSSAQLIKPAQSNIWRTASFSDIIILVGWWGSLWGGPTCENLVTETAEITNQPDGDTFAAVDVICWCISESAHKNRGGPGLICELLERGLGSVIMYLSWKSCI